MKKLTILLALCLSCQLYAQDDGDDYVMFHTIYLKAKSGHGQQLSDGLKAHNEKYHQEGMNTVNVWSIRSGPRSGGMSWVQGPLKWSHFDTPLSEDHMADWRENVAVHANVGEWEYWRLINDLDYMPDGFEPKVMQVRFFDIQTEKGNNARQLIKNIIKVYQENNLKTGFQMYANQAGTADGRDWAMLWFYDSWAAFDENVDFPAKYEAIFGEDSWDEFWEEWREAQEFTGMEIQSLVPGLSVGTTSQ